VADTGTGAIREDLPEWQTESLAHGLRDLLSGLITKIV
jgi:hypothetical protein